MEFHIDQYLELAKFAALKAGKEILNIYESSNDIEVVNKKDQSPLTAADKAAHVTIVEVLKNTNLPILSEEGKSISFDERINWDLYWLIDPLDGTKEFIKKNGEFTVNIALIQQGKPIMGVVYAPVLDTLYWGSKEMGAFKTASDRKAVKLTAIKQNEGLTIVASRSHLSKETQDFIEQYNDATLISMGSSLKFMLVAEGIAQLYPRFAPTMEWDTAAAQAVVESAGGEVLCYPSLEPLMYNRKDMLNGWFLVKGKAQL